jgi:hypothetical protein
MIERRPELKRLALALALAFVLVATNGSRGLAQGHTPDPYNIVGEYNSQYEPYMYATEPTPDGVFPNQARLMPRAGSFSANRFDNYVNSIDGAEPEAESSAGMRRSGIGTPYYRAYRRFDQDFKRVYRPNENADSSYYEAQRRRDDLYLDAMREKRDPRKRSQMLREYNLENLRAARGLSTARNAQGRDRSALATGSPASDDGSDAEPPLSSRRPSTPGAPGVRRGTIPPPPLSPLITRPRAGSRTGRDAARPLSRVGEAPLPFGSGLGSEVGTRRATEGAPSSVLERSQLLDPATRATAPRPSSPRTTAPPPPPH